MIVFIIIWVIWFGSEIFLNRVFHSGGQDLKGQDRGTMALIWITIGVANSLGILAVIFIDLTVSISFILPLIGLVLIVSGMMIRFISVGSLGRFFTVDVTLREDHKIKKDGIYKYIRHPSYLGSLISFLGFGLSLNNWISLAIVFVPVTIAMIIRINVEEKVLCGLPDSEYSGYMKRTYRLVPFIY
jgi:protein-S-isoprenylcysteine O-methyltransferase Ste14